MNRCLSCQKPVEHEGRYHMKCLRDLYGRSRAPIIPFGVAEMSAQVIKIGARMSISGVQMKLSVLVNPDTWTMEAVAVGGTHILKPESDRFPELPQNENLCMNSAAALDLPTPPHGLFPMADGTLGYVIKRFDRLADGAKLQKETMFQILGAEDKYRGSLEQVGKTIRACAANVGLECLDFFERTLLGFLIGNGDMHLKNWALLTNREGAIRLAPCYDHVSSKVYLPDEADSALTINGKRDNLSRADFEVLAASLKIDPKAAGHVFQKLFKAKEQILAQIRASALSRDMRDRLAGVLDARYTRLYP